MIFIDIDVSFLNFYDSNFFEIAKRLKDIATKTEKNAEFFHRAYSDFDEKNRYFRFNVFHKLENIEFKNATEKNKIIIVTVRYVILKSVMKQIKPCKSNLSTRKYASMFA